jgi:hypothetical protein
VAIGGRALGTLMTYAAQSRQWRRAYPGGLSMLELVRDFPAWLRCQKKGASPLTDARPWLTFPAIRFLERIVRKDMRVWEYGSGGSTLFFAARAAEVLSVEHDPEWVATVVETLRQSGRTNAHLKCIEPAEEAGAAGKDPADPEAYVSTHPPALGKTFRSYVSCIDEHADGTFDVILIDGRARPSCFKHSLSKVKPGGYIVWDNTERDYYLPAMHLVPAGFRFFDFPGPTPYVRHFSRTSVWQAPSDQVRVAATPASGAVTGP